MNDISSDSKLNLLTLRFENKTLEAGYKKASYQQALYLLRWSLLFSIFIELVYLKIDEQILKEGYEFMVNIRLFLLIPLSSAGLLLSFHPLFPRFHHLLIGSAVLIYGLCMSVGVYWYGETTAMYFAPGTIIVAIYGFYLLGLKFATSIVTAGIMVLVNIVTMHIISVSVDDFIQAQHVLVVTTLVLIMGAYQNEKISRRAYLHSLMLVDQEKKRIFVEQERVNWLENMANFLRHELKNSIIGVKTSLELLQRRNKLAINDKYLNRSQKGIHIIDNLLESVSRATSIESAFIQEEKNPVDLSRLVKEQVDQYLTIYDGIEINYIHDNSKLMILACEERILQILDNVVNNAVDHRNPDTRIDIILRKNANRGVLCVKNTGVRLPENKSLLFDLFASFRQNTGQESKRGIGLYIVKLIVEYYGGCVYAKDRTDVVGAEFIIELPII